MPGNAVPQPWSPEDDAKLIGLAKTAISWLAVAEAMERTPGSIRGRIQKLKLNLDPANVRVQRSASATALMRKPGVRARISASTKASWSDERKAAMRERSIATNAIAHAQAAPCDEAARQAAMKAYWERWWSWCPPSVVAYYTELIDKKGYRAAEAKKMALQEAARIETAERKAAAITPKARRSFEEELALAQAGLITHVEVTPVNRVFHLPA